MFQETLWHPGEILLIKLPRDYRCVWTSFGQILPAFESPEFLCTALFLEHFNLLRSLESPLLLTKLEKTWALKLSLFFPLKAIATMQVRKAKILVHIHPGLDSLHDPKSSSSSEDLKYRQHWFRDGRILSPVHNLEIETSCRPPKLLGVCLALHVWFPEHLSSYSRVTSYSKISSPVIACINLL